MEEEEGPKEESQPGKEDEKENEGQGNWRGTRGTWIAAEEQAELYCDRSNHCFTFTYHQQGVEDNSAAPNIGFPSVVFISLE